MTCGQILRNLNSHGVTRPRRSPFPLEGVTRGRANYSWLSHSCRERRPAGRTLTLWHPPELGIADPEVRNALEHCLNLAHSTETMVGSGERLAAARSAVDLVRAYDRVLENIRVVPLSLQEQQYARDRLAPVKDLLRKYRLR